MTSVNKPILLLLILMAAAAFVLLALPNAAASENMAMVAMFEPDEAAPLPYVLDMINPAPNLDQALRGFIFYEYYFYGFPYFALSALALIPVQWLGRTADTALVMLVLRQVISVLPTLLALLLLVFMQDGFRSYRSPVLFTFLLSVPAVLSNSLWWHVDGIVLLMVVLVLFCLARDHLRFGRWFFLAAIMTGIVTAAKLVGVYFFLAVGLTLLLGLVLKKIPLLRLVGYGAGYLGWMAVSFLAANPFLLSHWARDAYFQTFQKQREWLSGGYSIVYEKGLAASWPDVSRNYGGWLFLLVALGVALWAAARELRQDPARRYLYAIILAWFVPLTISIFTFSHFKPQYWLPAALPLFSCLAVLLPQRLDLRGFHISASRTGFIAGAACLLVELAQVALFAAADARQYITRLHRAQDNPRILFLDQTRQALDPLPDGPLHVYYDYRLYMPPVENWSAETNFELLEYGYLDGKNFDVLLLLEQRIRDYLNEGVTGVDPKVFALNQAFYRDADQNKLRGYRLIYRNPVGLVYVKDALYQQYYNP